MMSNILAYLFRFIGLLLLQVFIVGKLHLHPYVQPNIILLFLIILPMNLKPAPSLLLGFFSGLALDIFTDSAGFNSTSFLIVMLVRVYYLNQFTNIDIRESGMSPTIGNTGYRWFFIYSSILVLTHHLVYSFIEAFSLLYILSNILSALASSAVSLLLILLFQLLFFRTRKGQVV